VHQELGYTVPELNLGGGFGVTYTEEERKPFRYFLEPLMEKINGFYDEHGMRRPAVVIEPGRSIVAEAGMTLYSVGTTKEIPGIRKYAAVDGGMGDNIRPALYQAEYAGVLANRASERAEDCSDLEPETDRLKPYLPATPTWCSAS
jgi:diaminopimelate decarboxylase